MNLRGGVTLITGGGHRLGRAIALELAARGANVAIHYHRSELAAAETEKRARALGVASMRAGADAADAGAVRAMLDRVRRTLGPVDAWVAGAGVFRRTPPSAVAPADWTDMMRGNYETFRVPAEQIAPAMIARGSGSIVAIGDVAALRPWTEYLPYCVSKSRLLHRVRQLARQLAPAVRVNAVLPGPVLFPENYPDEARQRELANTLLGREGSAADIARAVAFLLENDYLTGTLLAVDGGRLLV